MNTKTAQPVQTLAGINTGHVRNLFADCLEAYAQAWAENNAAEANAPEELSDRSAALTALLDVKQQGMFIAHDALLAIVDLHTGQQVAEALQLP